MPRENMEGKMMNSLGFENSSQEIITKRGTRENELLMDERRPTPQHIAKSKGDGAGCWFDTAPTVTQLLDEALTTKHAEIDAAMERNVCTGFQCSALGSVHSYDCRDVDQKNIAQAIRIAESSGSEQYLAKETGQFFSMTSHTLSQLKEVDAAMFAHISANRVIARRKKGEAVAAHESGDIEAVKAVDVSDWT